MKTWEMIKELSENRELKFKQISGRTKGTVVSAGESGFEEPCIVEQNSYPKTILLDAEWELVRESVSWQEAIQAWINRKAISVELNGEKIIQPKYFKFGCFENADGFEMSHFKDGKWYIEE